MVLLDLEPGAYVDDAEFELAVSAAASVGARAIRDARTVSFVVSGRSHDGIASRISGMRELPTVSRDRLLDALCVVEPDEQAVLLPDVARAAASRPSARPPPACPGVWRRWPCSARPKARPPLAPWPA